MNTEADEINWEDLEAASDFYDMLKQTTNRTMFKQADDTEISGTSFFNNTFIATVDQLIKVFDEPRYDGNDGEDKVNFKWCLKTRQGMVFTIYDWKEYRPLGYDDKIEWHIGAHNELNSFRAYSLITNALKNIPSQPQSNYDAKTFHSLKLESNVIEHLKILMSCYKDTPYVFPDPVEKATFLMLAEHAILEEKNRLLSDLEKDLKDKTGIYEKIRYDIFKLDYWNGVRKLV